MRRASSWDLVARRKCTFSLRASRGRGSTLTAVPSSSPDLQRLEGADRPPRTLRRSPCRQRRPRRRPHRLTARSHSFTNSSRTSGRAQSTLCQLHRGRPPTTLPPSICQPRWMQDYVSWSSCYRSLGTCAPALYVRSAARGWTSWGKLKPRSVLPSSPSPPAWRPTGTL